MKCDNAQRILPFQHFSNHNPIFWQKYLLVAELSHNYNNPLRTRGSALHWRNTMASVQNLLHCYTLTITRTHTVVVPFQCDFCENKSSHNNIILQAKENSHRIKAKSSVKFFLQPFEGDFCATRKFLHEYNICGTQICIPLLNFLKRIRVLGHTHVDKSTVGLTFRCCPFNFC